jgi:hypothetical protein
LIIQMGLGSVCSVLPLTRIIPLQLLKLKCRGEPDYGQIERAVGFNGIGHGGG